MSNFIYITLDTTAPTNPNVLIEGGSTYTNSRLVDLTINTDDSITTGYQMKIWGDVDLANDPSVQATELSSNWITYSTLKQVLLSDTDGSKVVYLRLRDDVHNESSQTNDSITLNTGLPNVLVGSPDVAKISLKPTKNSASFTFTIDTVFIEYKVKVVSSTGAPHTTGELIGVVNGSVNTSGVGSFNTPITVTVKGSDLETASTGDGSKIIKVFVKNEAGTWSA